tara:strand:- start:3225 stop:4199 length:975 start_codon:yes stop_codon:yes gene_type:complete
VKAIFVHKFGLENPMILEEIDIPKPKSGQLLVKLGASGVNPSDVATRSGQSHHSSHMKTPYIPGLEAAGEIIELGDEVKEFHVGQRVFGRCLGGSYSEFVCLDASVASVLPDSYSFEEGAGITLPLRTAWNALVIKAKVTPGETVLVQGGAGGVGMATIQLARAMGCRVFATVSSSKKASFCTKLGATETINYKEEDFIEKCLELTKGLGVDVIVETAANENFHLDLKAIKVNGRIVLMGAGLGKNPRADFLVSDMIEKDARIFGITGVNLAKKMPFIVPKFSSLLEKGTIKFHVDKVFSLEHANDAHKLMLNGNFLGKLVLAS